MVQKGKLLLKIFACHSRFLNYSANRSHKTAGKNSHTLKPPTGAQTKKRLPYAAGFVTKRIYFKEKAK